MTSLSFHIEKSVCPIVLHSRSVYMYNPLNSRCWQYCTTRNLTLCWSPSTTSHIVNPISKHAIHTHVEVFVIAAAFVTFFMEKNLIHSHFRQTNRDNAIILVMGSNYIKLLSYETGC